MSYTYKLACRPCRVYLWIGQGWPNREPDKRYIYSSKEHVEALRRFLYEHETTGAKAHDLFFASLESGLVDDFREIRDEDLPRQGEAFV